MSSGIRSGRRRIVGFEPHRGNGAIGFSQHFTCVIPLNCNGRVAHGGSQQIGELVDIRLKTLALRIDWRVCLEQ